MPTAKGKGERVTICRQHNAIDAIIKQNLHQVSSVKCQVSSVMHDKAGVCKDKIMTSDRLLIADSFSDRVRRSTEDLVDNSALQDSHCKVHTRYRAA